VIYEGRIHPTVPRRRVKGKKGGSARKDRERAGRQVVKAGRQVAACEGLTWKVGVKAEGVAADMSLPVSSPEAMEDPTNSYFAATAVAGGRLQ
jgi:hypothetical protein